MHTNKVKDILCKYDIEYDIYSKMECGTHVKFIIKIYNFLTDDIRKNVILELKNIGNCYSYFDDEEETLDFYILMIEIARENVYDAEYLPISKKGFFERMFDDVPIGVDYFGKSKYYSLETFAFMQILGDIDSGKYDFLKSILYYLSEAYTEEELSIEIIDLNKRFVKFKYLPNVKAYITDPKLAIKVLNIKLREGEIRKNLFDEKKVGSFKQYNVKSDNKLSHRFVLIDGYNELIRADSEFMISRFIKFFSEGYHNGMYFLLSEENIRKTDDFSLYKIMFKTSLENSFNFFGTEYGSVLGGHGDFVLRQYGDKRFQAFKFDEEKFIK